MSKTVHVDLENRSYDIHIGKALAEGLCLSGNGRNALIISDSNVDPLHGKTCSAALKANGFVPVKTVVPAGEPSKSLAVVGELYDKCIEAGLDRSSYVVALGGGVVGDLAGFVAATFLRGVNLIQIPTTVLSMVDSSVGGKTGVNLSHGKNLVGSFYQPKQVIADLSFLKTLPQREYVSGLAEVVKYGIIWDSALFTLLEKNVDSLLAVDDLLLEEVIARCCEIKAEVVAMDERESGVRAILNFGHTLGHAFENVCGYGKWLHGEAISAGMVYAADLSVKTKGFPLNERNRLASLLDNLGLPLNKSAFEPIPSWSDIRKAISSDKKSVNKTPQFVLAGKIGAVEINCEVSEDDMEDTYYVSS